MKRLLSTLIPLLAAYAAAAQFYHPGEVLEYPAIFASGVRYRICPVERLLP